MIAWGFALYVPVVAPSTRGARWLVAMLLVDGLAVITSYYNSRYTDPFLESLGLPTLPPSLHQASDWALVAVYLPFLGITLSSPLVAPLKNPWVSRSIFIVGLAIALLVLLLPAHAAQRFAWPFYAVICAVLAYGFVAAMHSWYIASSESERGRARAFTIAFGIRDIFWTATFAYFAAAHFDLFGITAEELQDINTVTGFMLPLLYQLAVIIYVPLVAYGVLRVQLFDVDLRVKRTLRRGTVAAAFVATFFVISEFASNYLSNQFGTAMGILATGLLVFFLDRIQRAAEKVSDAAMPNTKDTPEYHIFRKLQVYESALKAAFEDGEIGQRERHMLDSMVQSLGIDPASAKQLELEMAGQTS